jgi:nicotinamide mononucleotide (NMN) deamidase PncC
LSSRAKRKQLNTNSEILKNTEKYTKILKMAAGGKSKVRWQFAAAMSGNQN